MDSGHVKHLQSDELISHDVQFSDRLQKLRYDSESAFIPILSNTCDHSFNLGSKPNYDFNNDSTTTLETETYRSRLGSECETSASFYIDPRLDFLSNNNIQKLLHEKNTELQAIKIEMQKQRDDSQTQIDDLENQLHLTRLKLQR